MLWCLILYPVLYNKHAIKSDKPREKLQDQPPPSRCTGVFSKTRLRVDHAGKPPAKRSVSKLSV